MIIEKKQKDTKRYAFGWSYFNSGREGFKHILQTDGIKNKKILIPSYIGYSSREGSGVFDPIRETKTSYVFYGMDKRLNIDTEDIKAKIRQHKENILFIIHYFGFIDNNLGAIKEYARIYRMTIIEDFAQAFFTFWLNPVINFDYAIFSIHKLFPVDTGGMVIGKTRIPDTVDNGSLIYNLFNYDMKRIIKKRIENYNYILSKLKNKTAVYRLRVLRKKFDGAVPQTFPVLVQDAKIRDRLYFQMNKEGYGVVSLYHTLINEIDESFAVEHEVSSRILNLPVHQDAEKDKVDRMLKRMFEIIKNYNEKRA